MITIEKKGKEYFVKNKLSEVNLFELDRLTEINMNENLNQVNKRIEIIKVLGLPNDVANSLGAKSLIEITQHTIVNIDGGGMKRQIEVQGNTYTAFDEGDEFDLTGGQLAKIEDIYKEQKNLASKIMAVIFQGDDKYEDRVNLFQEHLTADIAAPYINWIELNVLETIKSLVNES